MRRDVGLAWAAALATVAAALVPRLLRLRGNPKEKERRRREAISALGRVIEGYATCQNGIVEYSYEWRGVRYEASQDITEFLTPDLCADDFSGSVTVKFLRESPANSIVVSENWSGLPSVRRASRSRVPSV